MSAQSDQKYVTATTNEQQEQSAERKGMVRSSSRTDLPPGRAASPFGLAPLDLFRTNPFSLLRRMAEEMDRVFQEVGLERADGNDVGWSPAIEVSQREGKFIINAELPGLEPKDVKVEVQNDSVVIQGERKFEHEETERGMRRMERQYGIFYRSIPLPEGAKVEQAQAKFRNGVLEISIPVPEQQSNRRTIPIEGERTSSEPSKSQAA
jgi:HSP20 family protein